jgi:hypothetical protein
LSAINCRGFAKWRGLWVFPAVYAPSVRTASYDACTMPPLRRLAMQTTRRQRRPGCCFPRSAKRQSQRPAARMRRARAGSIKRCRLFTTALARETRFPHAAGFMLLDQRGTGAKDGRKGEKETSNGCSIAAADKAGEDRCGAAQTRSASGTCASGLPAAMTGKIGSASCLPSGKGQQTERDDQPDHER